MTQYHILSWVIAYVWWKWTFFRRHASISSCKTVVVTTRGLIRSWKLVFSHQYLSFDSTKPYVVGIQKNHLGEIEICILSIALNYILWQYLVTNYLHESHNLSFLRIFLLAVLSHTFIPWQLAHSLWCNIIYIYKKML